MTNPLANPYDSPFPVERLGELYGRQSVLQRLASGLFRSQRILSHQIVGVTRIGKSSIINVLASLNQAEAAQNFASQVQVDLPPVMGTVFIKVDCLGLDDNEPGTFWHFLDEQFSLAIDGHHTLVDKDIYPSGNIDSLKGFSDRLEHVLGAQVEVRQVVFLFDEFDRVARQVPIEVSAQLRYLLDKFNGRLAYITATRRPLYDYYYGREAADIVSPLNNYFSLPIRLGLLEEVDGSIHPSTRRFAERTKGVTQFSEETIKIIQQVSGGHPDIARDLYVLSYEKSVKQECRLSYAVALDRAVDYFHSIYGALELTYPRLRQDVAAIFTPGSRLSKLQQRTLIDSALLRLDGEQLRPFSPVLEAMLSDDESNGSPLVKAERHLVAWPERRVVQVHGKPELLSPSEWRLFELLVQQRGEVVERNVLLQGLTNAGEVTLRPSALDTLVSRLRQKLERNPAHPHFLHTIHGRGLRLDLPDDFELRYDQS